MIYYVEDDTNIRDLTLYALKQAGFEAEGYPHASDFFQACLNRMPDLVLLDIMLPEVDGLEILKTICKTEAMKHLLIMMLTAKGTEYDTVCGLDAGADDYLAKPFGMMELVSRVNALMRRVGDRSSEGDTLTCAEVVLSTTTHTVQVGENQNPVELTLKEFDLLHMLMRNEGQVFSRAQLLQEVWGMSYAGETRTVDVHIQTLRQKLAQAQPGSEVIVSTVRGVGYCVKASEQGR